jgi:hypothetical protein
MNTAVFAPAVCLVLVGSAWAQAPGEYVPRAKAEAALRTCRKAALAIEGWRAKFLARKRCQFRYRETLRGNERARREVKNRREIAESLLLCRKAAGDEPALLACNAERERRERELAVAIADAESELIRVSTEAASRLHECLARGDGGRAAAYAEWLAAAKKWGERLRAFTAGAGPHPGWSLPPPPPACRADGATSPGAS